MTDAPRRTQDEAALAAARSDIDELRAEVAAQRTEIDALRAALSERHEAQAPSAAGDKLAAVTQALADLVFFLTPGGVIVDYQASQSIPTYVPPSEFLGRRMVDLLPAQPARMIEDALEAIARGEALYVVEYPLDEPSGERWYEGRFAPLSTHSVVAVVRDVTAHVEAQRQLEEANGHLAAIVEALPDWMVVVELDGTIRRIQAPTRDDDKHATPDVEQLVGRRVRDVIPQELAEMAEGILERQRTHEHATESFEFEWDLLGERRFFQARVVPCGADAVLGLFRDLTGLRRAMVRRSELRLETTERQKREALSILAGGIAHDFNNILTGVLGNVGLARMELPPSTSIGESLREIEHAAQRGAALSRQMLAFSGQGRFLVAPADLSQVVQRTLGRVARALPASARLVVDLAEGLPPAQCDAEQVAQALVSLTQNAAEALREGFGTVRVSTSLAVLDEGLMAPAHSADERFVERPEPGRYVTLTVADDGAGMDAATMSRACDPFFSTRFTGRGLGLPAVLGIVRGHGGGLMLRSTPGRGTTATLYFPVEPPPDERGVPAAPASEHEVIDRGPRVLVVDDEELVLSVAQRSLQGAGFQVALARDGLEALELIRRAPEPFDLVILDLTMPRMGGVETFAELRRVDAEIPVILSSGYSLREATARFSSEGLAGFLQKPYRPSSLRGLVQETLAHHGTRSKTREGPPEGPPE